MDDLHENSPVKTETWRETVVLVENGFDILLHSNHGNIKATGAAFRKS